MSFYERWHFAFCVRFVESESLEATTDLGTHTHTHKNTQMNEMETKVVASHKK